MKLSGIPHYASVIASLPTRERGLKHVDLHNKNGTQEVAPYTGAWIETAVPGEFILMSSVAPYTGAWIETVEDLISASRKAVAPYTGAWIETCSCSFTCSVVVVAPYTGAWIETNEEFELTEAQECRSLHGSVD